MSTIKVEEIQHPSNSNNAVSIASDSSVSLKHSGSAKLATTATGISVTGTCTATTFSGSGANLTSLPAANLTGTLPAIDGSALTGISSTHPAWFGSQHPTYQQNLSSSTYTTITGLANDVSNPTANSGGWNNATGIFTVQSGQAGIYYAFGSVGIDDIQGDDLVRCIISKNDSNDENTVGETRAQEQEGNKVYQAQISKIVSLAVGDTLRLKGWHNEGSSEFTEHYLTYFGGFRIFAT